MGPNSMKPSRRLIRGTLFLTLAGICSRFLGFFYKIILSHLFDAEEIGILQLTGPILALTMSLTASGLQASISKYVAAHKNSNKHSFYYLFCGIFLSLGLSVPVAISLYLFSDVLAISFLKEIRCGILLRIFSFSVPLASVHSCINGYFYGLKSTKIPALSQIGEQMVRVFFSLSLYYYLTSANHNPSIAICMIGAFAGELFSFSLCILTLRLHNYTNQHLTRRHLSIFRSCTRDLCQMTAPLTLNRILINLLQCYETSRIPHCLCLYGLSHKEALKAYGILTGMSLPILFFPGIIIGSVSTLLLPSISQAQAEGRSDFIQKTIRICILYCSVLGTGATMFFLFFGKKLGIFLFHNPLAGSFLTILSILCPFLYLSTTLTSILHGLGRTTVSFLIHIGCLVLRLIFILLAIPRIGIAGYLYGLILGEILCSLLCLVALRKELYYNSQKLGGKRNVI